MKITKIAQNNFNKFPTRFDDIQKEIEAEKLKGYFVQKPKVEIKQGTYLMGEVLGKVLNKIG